MGIKECYTYVNAAYSCNGICIYIAIYTYIQVPLQVVVIISKDRMYYQLHIYSYQSLLSVHTLPYMYTCIICQICQSFYCQTFALYCYKLLAIVLYNTARVWK